VLQVLVGCIPKSSKRLLLYLTPRNDPVNLVQ
jgi:hypothetical protein